MYLMAQSVLSGNFALKAIPDEPIPTHSIRSEESSHVIVSDVGIYSFVNCALP